MPATYIRAAGAGLALALATGAPAEARQAVQRDSVPGTLVAWELVAVPGGAVTVPGREGPQVVQVAPFLLGRTEVTWDLYDLFAFGLDEAAAVAGADAFPRPSRPYGAPDYGFGHQGYPVISVAREAAMAFAEWLSDRTGHRYRLPTEAEWQRAAELAGAASVDALAWHAGNAGGKSHPVGARPADALGLHDLFGNAAEWVVSADGRRVTRGGSWRDPLERVGPHARAVQDDSWNERDPQFPKSAWWLSDGPFVGFRLVREP